MLLLTQSTRRITPAAWSRPGITFAKSFTLPISLTLTTVSKKTRICYKHGEFSPGLLIPPPRPNSLKTGL
jgi:hypothetical protein